jgi:hypothetical protein
MRPKVRFELGGPSTYFDSFARFGDGSEDAILNE